MALYGLYVLLTEVAGNSRLNRHTVTSALFSLFVLLWITWLFVSVELPYGWGHDFVAVKLGTIQPAWLRVSLWIGWVALIFIELLVPHALYRSRRAGDGLVVLILVISLIWILSPLNSLYGVVQTLGF